MTISEQELESKIREFIEKISQKEMTRFPGQVGIPNSQTNAVQACIQKLSPKQRDELATLIENMS